MTVFDLFMVILGLVLIAVSFFFGEKASAQSQKNQSSASNNEFDEERILSIQNTVEENLKKLSESTIAKTENNLNKVTNEKIMAITDYSDQILEKIDQNHTEVVFLYNMLNEKDAAIKESYNKPNKTTNLNSTIEKKLNISESSQSNRRNTSKEDNLSRNIHGINDEEAALLTQSLKNDANVDKDTDLEQIQQTDIEIHDNDKNNKNEEIIKLYEEGKSITEIAKTLDLGKGEVTFVVNLFKKK